MAPPAFCPRGLPAPAPLCWSQLVTFLGEGVEKGQLSLGEVPLGRGTGRLLDAPTVEEQIQGLLRRAGRRGVS